MDLLNQLAPELLDGDGLGRIAQKLVEPSEALRNPATRAHIVGLLPLPKARELASRLGVDGGRAVFAHLNEAVADQSSLPILCSFFGVVSEARAPAYRPPDVRRLAPDYGLFDYQRIAATRVRQMLSEDPRKVVLHMPTGSGKTRTAMHIVSAHFKAHRPTLVVWLAQSEELLEQAASEFERAWGYIGDRALSLARFWGHRRLDPLSVTDGIIVAGLGKLHSLNKRSPATILRLADRASLTVIDEAHQALAPTYNSILSALYTKRPANRLLGLTATPGRTWADISEDQELADLFGRRKVTLEMKGYADPVTFLIDEGFLARPTFLTLNSEAGLDVSKRDIAALSRAVDIPSSILERLETMCSEISASSRRLKN